MPTKRRRFMVNIPPELEPLVIARAKALKRPVANYLEWLVAQDLDQSASAAPGGEQQSVAYPEDGPVIGPNVLDDFLPQAGKALPPTHSPRKSKPTPAAPR